VTPEPTTRSSGVIFKSIVAAISVLVVALATPVTSFFRRDDKALTIVKAGGDIDVDGAPRGADLVTMGGDIHIGRVDSFAKLETMGGNIDVDAASGSVHAKTMSGDIVAHIVGTSGAPRDINLSSNQGEITLVVPKDFPMTVDVTLAYTDNQETAFHVIDDFGLRQVKSDNWDKKHGTPRQYIYANGRVGAGTNRVTISTINGNVTLTTK
jgi:Putative adhesin